MPFDRQHWALMGASVRGRAHLQARLPNQDAWHGRLLRSHGLVVVCDGLGSRAHSDRGAQSACIAVAVALQNWQRTPEADPQLLLRLIHALWNIRVGAHGRDACATTCLFAAVLGDGRIMLAQLGDGLVAIRSDAGFVALPDQRKSFGNITTGLGVATDLRDWRLQVLPAVQGNVAILLATDGVADDLVPEQSGAFLDHLVGQYGAMPQAARSRALAATLRAWPTPLSNDDKTLAVLWNHGARRELEQTI